MYRISAVKRLFLYIFALFFAFLSFSCPSHDPETEFQECYLTIRYYTNNYDGSVKEGFVNSLYYAGEYLPRDIGSFIPELNSQTAAERGLGYGYFTEDEQFSFKANNAGAYEFISNDGSYWDTSQPLPGGEFVITPKYVNEVKDCSVTVYYFVEDNVTDNSRRLKSFEFSVKYGTRLLDYKQGSPELWSDGAWKPDVATGEYQYVFNGDIMIVKNSSYNGASAQDKRKIYYFDVGYTGSGNVFDSSMPVMSQNLILYSLYINYSVIDITLNYKDVDSITGNEVERTLVLPIKRGGSIASYYNSSEPKDWGDKSWLPDITGEYSYTITNKTTGRTIKNILDKNFAGKWLFTDVSTNTLVTADTVFNNYAVISANYKSYDITITKVVDFVFYVNEDSKMVEKVFTLNLDSSNDKMKYTYDVEKLIPLHEAADADDRLKYGYVDYNNYSRAYYFDKSSDGYYHFVYTTDKSNYEKSCTNEVNFGVGDMQTAKKITIKPVYTKAGYRPQNITFGNNTGIKFVYLPGNNNAGWPYTQKNASGNNTIEPYGVSSDNSGKTHSYTDEIDTTHNVSNMMVSEMMLNQSEVKGLYDRGKTKGYKLTSSAESFSQGLKYYSTTYVPWNYISYRDAMVMCNMLTALYNEAHSLNIEPVYTYKTKENQNWIEYKDATFISWSELKTSGSSKGFRIPVLHEWEYMAKVVTDERQLPDDKTLLMSSNGSYYRKVASYNVNGTYYIGSGTGLAEYDSSSHIYDTSTLRTRDKATGRSSDDAISVFNQNIKQKVDSNGKVNYNVRNGAGLYNMSGMLFQIVNTNWGGDSTKHCIKGGSWSYKLNSSALRLGFIEYSLKTADTSLSSNFGLRVCKYL